MFLTAIDPSAWFTPRAGEIRLGQTLACLAQIQDISAYHQAIEESWQQGQRIAIVGVPESIGRRANLGRGGAEHAFGAALKGLLSLQSNPMIADHELLLVGQVDVTDLQQQGDALRNTDIGELAHLRELVERLDQRVQQVVQPLFECGFDVILIGGGHNNAYPLIRALKQASGTAVGAVNLDPHADFRAREGRHSGNGFSYAYMEDALKHYHVVGLHEGKNNADSLKQFSDAEFTYRSVHELYVSDWRAELQATAAQAEAWHVPLGIEVDVDALQGVPASAINFNGLSIAQGYSFVECLASLPRTRYVHLAEAAPSLHPAGREAGDMACAQLLSELVLAYLHGFQRRSP